MSLPKGKLSNVILTMSDSDERHLKWCRSNKCHSN